MSHPLTESIFTPLISRTNNCLKTFFEVNICKLYFSIQNRSSFPLCLFDSPKFFLEYYNLFCFAYFPVVFNNFFLQILMVIISLELTRLNPDRNIFSINVEEISFFYSTEVWSITITEFQIQDTVGMYTGLMQEIHSKDEYRVVRREQVSTGYTKDEYRVEGREQD